MSPLTKDALIIKSGDVFTYERTISEEEVLQFARISGDYGQHHIVHDEFGRLMVHGLLTISIGTKIVGDFNYIAREVTTEFIRPVFTRDTITCELTIKEVTQMEGFKRVAIELIYKNQHEKEVVVGSSHGIIRD